MEALGRADAKEGGHVAAALMPFDERRQGNIAESVGVVGEKDVFAIQVFAHGAQPLADIGKRPRIHEGDFPIFDIAMEQGGLADAAFEDEIVREAFVVVEEIILDAVGLVAQGQYEILMPVMGVIFHQMPKDGAVADGDHGLGDIFGKFPQAHSLAAAE